MSVRRLAEESVQPKAFAFSEENAGWAESVIRKYPEGRQQSAVIPLLMRAQEQDGWVTKAAIEHVADKLRMPMIRVLEVATFYTQFQLKPVGTRAHVQVCGTTPCMLRGSDALKDVCRKHIHPEPFHLNESGTLSWEEVECLGACVNAPMVMIFKDTYEDLTGERLAEIIEAFDKGEGATVRKGPQIDRHLSVPASGLTTLNTFGDDDDVGDAGEPRTRSSAPASGAATPSQAGRVDTNAAETDPRIQAAGKADETQSRTAQTAEKTGDPAEGAERPGSGRTGGTQQGPTGQVERDKAEFGAASGSVDGEPRSDGPLAQKGEAAEHAVVDERKFVGNEKRTTSPAQDLSNRESGAKDTLEGERSGTSDTTEGSNAPKRPGGDAGKTD